MHAIDIQHNQHFEFPTSLLPAKRGWFANHALQSRELSGLSVGR
jgi:hypothetical protein